MAKSTTDKRIFSALEVAKICGVVNQTAINWIRSGYLKAFTTPGGQYRIYAEDLIQFLEQRGMRIPDILSEQAGSNIQWNRVLVIDDDAIFNCMLRDFISAEFPGSEVLQAYDGFDAGRLVQEKRPGFIILDINLPGVDGHALCRRIKEDEVLGKPFIIAVSGMDVSSVRDRILQEGADAFMGKPVELGSLSGLLRELQARVKA